MRGPSDLVPCRDCISCGTEKACAICTTHCHAGHTLSEELKWSRCTCNHNDPKLNNIFNGLLIWLAIFDNCFMITCLVENTWRHFGVSWHYTFDIGYCFMLYPFKNFALTCITNTQVALSIERFKAIR